MSTATYYLEQKDMLIGDGREHIADTYAANRDMVAAYNAPKEEKDYTPGIDASARNIDPMMHDIMCNIPYGPKYFDFHREFPGLISYNDDDLSVNVFVTSMDFLEMRPQKMRFGKYLKKLERYDINQINDMVNEFKSTVRSLAGAELYIATTEEDIVRVYTEGPNSCMSGSFCDSGIHPAAVYAGPDTAVAYTMVNERIVARAVLNQRDQQYSTIYGNNALLEKLLKQAGYEPGDICGCRIRKINLYGDVYAMPYIDGADEVREDQHNPDEFFIVEGGGGDFYSCTGTNGTTEDGMFCPHCDSSFNPDYDGTYVEAADATFCCDECAEHAGYIQVSDYGEWYSMDDCYYCETDSSYYVDTDSLVEIDGEWYRADDDDIVYSEDQDEYIFINDAVYIDSIDSWVDDDREHEFEEDEDHEEAA